MCHVSPVVPITITYQLLNSSATVAVPTVTEQYYFNSSKKTLWLAQTEGTVTNLSPT